MCIDAHSRGGASGHPALMALSAEHRLPLAMEIRGLREENHTLYGVIKLVSSSLELEPMLQGVVDLATEASGCHACFIYLLEDGQLTIRAASPVFSRSRRAGPLLGPGGTHRLGRAPSHAGVHP